MSETQAAPAPAEAEVHHDPLPPSPLLALQGEPITLEQKAVSSIDFNAVGRWLGTISIGGAILALELTGHAPTGTFLNYVAIPSLALLGIHTVAKTLN